MLIDYHFINTRFNDLIQIKQDKINNKKNNILQTAYFLYKNNNNNNCLDNYYKAEKIENMNINQINNKINIMKNMLNFLLLNISDTEYNLLFN